jgi:hypothetical protein
MMDLEVAAAPALYLAICYRCAHMEAASGETRCARCAFPTILVRGDAGTAGQRLRDIFDRSSVNVGAPPLPGVDRPVRRSRPARQPPAGPPPEPAPPASAAGAPWYARPLPVVALGFVAAVTGVLAALLCRL